MRDQIFYSSISFYRLFYPSADDIFACCNFNYFLIDALIGRLQFAIYEYNTD